MKSKIAILACIAVATVMVLPSVSAGDMDLWVYTDDDEYDMGDTVGVNVDWAITDPNDFDHDYCYVYIVIQHQGSSYFEDYWGDYDATTSHQTGDFPVYCSGLYGYADFPWDTSAQPQPKPYGFYKVHGYVWAYDDSQSPPNNVITRNTWSSEFELK